MIDRSSRTAAYYHMLDACHGHSARNAVHIIAHAIQALRKRGPKTHHPYGVPLTHPAGQSMLRCLAKRGFLRRTVGHIKAVDGIDLEVKEGQTLAVVGESGSGKTTLGLALLRLVSSDGPIIYLGNRIDGYDSKRMRPLRRDIQIVFQDPYGSLSPRLSIGQIIEEGLGIQAPDLSRAERDARVTRALNEVGLDPTVRDRYPHEFSGGQRQRIAIARALVL